MAAAAAGVLVGEGHTGAIYNATGPAALTGAEQAALVAEVTGKPFAFAAVTEEQLRGGLAGAGLPETVVNTVTEIKAQFAGGCFDIVTGDVERLSGRRPKSLGEVLRTALG